MHIMTQLIVQTNSSMYSEAFRFIPNYCYLLDKNCILLDCNQSFLNYLNLHTLPEKKLGTIYQLMGTHGSWSEEQIQQIKKNDIDAILSGLPTKNTPELPRIDDKGTVTYFEASRIPLKDENGSVMGLLVIFNDVSKEHQLMDQLEKISSQLNKQNTTTSLASSVLVKPASTAKQQAPRILIVEDNTIAQKAAQSILMNNDCLVEIAENEEQLQALFEPGKYDLIFMDIGLENTSGYIMAKQLRLKEQGSGHHVPIIALTGYAADVVQFDCDYYQMEGVITKPLTALQVKQLIQHYIFHINMEVTGLKGAAHHKS